MTSSKGWNRKERNKLFFRIEKLACRRSGALKGKYRLIKRKRERGIVPARNTEMPATPGRVRAGLRARV